MKKKVVKAGVKHCDNCHRKKCVPSPIKPFMYGIMYPRIGLGIQGIGNLKKRLQGEKTEKRTK